MIAALNLDIDDREKTIREQEREINRLMEGADNRQTGAGDAGLETPRKQRARKKAGPHIRQRSQLPSELIVMLGDAQDDVDQEIEDEFDEKDKADVDEDEINKQLEVQFELARGEHEAVAAVLGIEKEEAIRKSTIFQGGTPFRDSQLYRESHTRESHQLSLP